MRNSFDEGRGKSSEFLQGEFIRTDDQSCRYERQARVLHLELGKGFFTVPAIDGLSWDDWRAFSRTSAPQSATRCRATRQAPT